MICFLSLLVFLFGMQTMMYPTSSEVLSEKPVNELNESNKKMVPQNRSGQLLILSQPAYKLSWFEAPMFSPVFAESLAQMWPFACAAYVPVEMDFLKKYNVDVVGKEPYYKQFEALFAPENGVINWDQARKVMQDILHGHFNFDVSQMPQEICETFKNDRVFFVQVQDVENLKPLGFIAFLQRADYPKNTIKVMYLAVDIKHQGRGFGKILMSSIFKIVPDLQRLFLCTRVTNDVALNAYAKWGFVAMQNPIMDHPFNLNHWTFMEYQANREFCLQNISKDLM